MDRLDKSIIRELKKNARASFVSIADKLNVSEATVRARVKKLEKSGIIVGYKAVINDKNMVQALVNVKTETKKNIEEIAEKIAEISGSDLNLEVMGEFDIVTIINAENTEELNYKIERIRKLSGVRATTSVLILRRY